MPCDLECSGGERSGWRLRKTLLCTVAQNTINAIFSTTELSKILVIRKRGVS